MPLRFFSFFFDVNSVVLVGPRRCLSGVRRCNFHVVQLCHNRLLSRFLLPSAPDYSYSRMH